MGTSKLNAEGELAAHPEVERVKNIQVNSCHRNWSGGMDPTAHCRLENMGKTGKVGMPAK